MRLHSFLEALGKNVSLLFSAGRGLPHSWSQPPSSLFKEATSHLSDLSSKVNLLLCNPVIFKTQVIGVSPHRLLFHFNVCSFNHICKVPFSSQDHIFTGSGGQDIEILEGSPLFCLLEVTFLPIFHVTAAVLFLAILPAHNSGSPSSAFRGNFLSALQPPLTFPQGALGLCQSPNHEASAK